MRPGGRRPRRPRWSRQLQGVRSDVAFGVSWLVSSLTRSRLPAAEPHLNAASRRPGRRFSASSAAEVGEHGEYAAVIVAVARESELAEDPRHVALDGALG